MEFWDSFLAVAQKVGLLAILVAVGVLCRKAKILNEDASKRMADLVMYLVTPCVIIHAFSATLYPKEELLPVLRNIGLVALVSLLVHVVMIAIVTLTFRFRNEDYRKVLRFGTVLSNTGFVALPLAQALIDTDTSHEGALYASVYLAVFNIVLWTWGFLTMSRETEKMSPKNILLSPGLIGVIVGLFLFTTPLYWNVGGHVGLQLPAVLSETLSCMSALNLPLPMFVVGFYLAGTDFRAALKDGWSYLCITLRLVVFPMATLGALYLLGVRGNVLTVCVIGASAPVGTTTTIFSAKFRRDTELSVRLVSLSTILSVITMPCIIGLTQMLA